MAAPILNDRDLILQNSAYRSKNTLVTVTADAGAFKTAKNGGATLPENIKLTATPNNVYTSSAVYTWHYALSATPTTWVLLGTGTVRTILNTDLLAIIGSSTQVQYRCTVTENLLDTAYGFFTVLYTLEPSEAITVALTRTNAVLTSDSSGNIASFANTDTTITVSRGNTPLNYSATAAANSFSVSIDTAQAAGRTAGTTSSITTSWTLDGITALSTDGAKVVFIITVYDASGIAVSPTIGREIVYNKVANGTLGADGVNLYPIANYDFATATLPSGVTYPGTKATSDGDTTTTLTNTAATQSVLLTSLTLVPANSYVISMRIKVVSGTWVGKIAYTSATRAESITGYYKSIPQPATGTWTTINLDMRNLTLPLNSADYLASNISQLRFDFVSDIGGQVVVDYISVGKYGVAEATKYATVTAYAWSNTGSAPTRVATGAYTWSTALVDTYPSGYTSNAPAAPGVGYTLYQLSLPIKDVATATTTTVDWNSTAVAINTIGYKVDGSIGPRGQSYRTCYIVTTSSTPPSAPTAATGDAAPTGWSFTATSTLTSINGVSQYMYQSDGILTGTPGDLTSATSISWGNPYLSNLKVGNLRAISADMGVITAGTLTAGTIFAGALSAASGTFTGALSGATGEFAGTLRAGVLDLTTFAGISYTYSSASTYSLSVPSGKTSMRVTLVGAGGGGGGGASRPIYYSAAGGGGGGLITQVFSGLTAGVTVSVTVGAGGTGAGAFDPGTGQQTGASGTAGGNTTVSYNGTLYAQATGGGGGGGAGYNQPAGGASGGTGATAGSNGISADTYDPINNYYYTGVASGGSGGNSRYGTGGIGGIANSGTPATAGGIGAGGGGGGLNFDNNNAGMTSASGGPGYAIIEFFDPNTVVLKSEFDVLKSALSRQGIAVT